MTTDRIAGLSMQSNTSALASFPCLKTFRAVRSVFSYEKKLSMAALSQTLPGRLMLQTMPLSAIKLELFADILAARSEGCIRAFGVFRRQTAIRGAPAINWAAMLALMDQPTTRRESRSITADT